MSYNANPRRKLSHDIDISTLLSMRQDGMTNKQIADSLGVSPTTIYNYIGKKSVAAKVAQMQNRTVSSAISSQTLESKAEKLETVPMNKSKAEETVSLEQFECQQTAEIAASEPEEKWKEMGTALRVISSRLALQGNLCKYIVETENDSIEIDGGDILKGLLDSTALSLLIDELMEIRKMFHR